MPLRRTRAFDSPRQEVHTVLENDDVGGDDVRRKKRIESLMEMFPTYQRNSNPLSPPPFSSSSVVFFNLAEKNGKRVTHFSTRESDFSAPHSWEQPGTLH